MSKATPLRFLVIGAGDAGRMAVQEMQRHSEYGFIPAGFIDDDPAKQGTSVSGVPVVGTRTDIPRAIQELDVDELLIALPSASGSAIRGIIRFCENERVRFRVVPGIWSIIRGDVHIQQIRPVNPEDLLGRETVELDLPLITGAYQGKRLLVTGAGGSIGSEICRQLLLAKPEKLVIVGRGENSVFEAGLTFRDRFPDAPLEIVIGDVRDPLLVEELFRRHKPHAVFHAAAHKHVWLMEINPEEAVANNVLATAGVIDAAIRHEAERFVLISTDKAVNPRSVMGATKRLAELYLLERAAASGGTRLMAVRFGNVLGSRGSVVPVFQRQIAAGGPVTVSHPDVARYFMTVHEAALLVVEAGALGEGGEIFILDMGEQMPIVELARDLVIFSGFRPDVDIPITIVGLKQGEKLREELVHKFETLEDTPVKGLRVTRGGGVRSEVTAALPVFAEAIRNGNGAGVVRDIERLVPEAKLAESLVPGYPRR